MEYILTKAELDNLVPLEIKIKLTDTVRKMRLKILKLANFGCVYDRKSPMSYCDDCPCSKAADNWADESQLMCELNQHFSK